MIILAIETSCDETAVAIVEFSKNKVRVLSNVISSQIRTHSKYGGVVPSLASRMHLKNMTPVLRRAFQMAERKEGYLINTPLAPLKMGISVKLKIDYIAVTKGPGLIPALMIGVSAAKALAYSLNNPLVAVNHLEGHIYANWLTPISKTQNSSLRKLEFPILCLIVSGGHTQLVLMKKDLNYKIIGETVDDAAGEAFDKVAKLLGLKYPGGPLIEKIAKKGNRNKFNFTRPMMNSKDYNFSFSGLKTAVLYEIKSSNSQPPLTPPCQGGKEMDKLSFSVPHCQIDKQYQADIAASFQQAVIDVLKYKTVKAAREYKVKSILLGGGVSANKELQKQLKEIINKEIPNTEYRIPNTKLTTDNALMIAVAAYYNIIGRKNVKDWKSVKADANLRL